MPCHHCIRIYHETFSPHRLACLLTQTSAALNPDAVKIIIACVASLKYCRRRHEKRPTPNKVPQTPPKRRQTPESQPHTHFQQVAHSKQQCPTSAPSHHLRLPLSRPNMRIMHLCRKLETRQCLVEMCLQRTNHDKHECF